MKFGHYDLSEDERKEYKILTENENSILFGDSAEKLLILIGDNEEDVEEFKEGKVGDFHFDLDKQFYLVGEEDKDSFEGPYKFMDLLKSMKPVEVHEDDSE